MSRPLTRVLPVIAMLLGMSLIPLASAQADVPRAANGQRCTIVGTHGPDLLIGTSSRDVICGLGGNDRIFGAGGNDVLDGGGGRDRIWGGDGSDLLIGGKGHDVLDGGPGDDVLRGGPGDDRLRGGSGRDQLLGGPGGDQLTGGDGADDLRGGRGLDACLPHVVDTLRSCVADSAGPRIHWVRFDKTELDVTTAAARLEVRFRASDDARVLSARLSLKGDEIGSYLRPVSSARISGTSRDGVWRSEFRVPRGFPEDVLGARLDLRDGLGNSGSWFRDDALTVHDASPDPELPQVELLSPIATRVVDTRTGPRSVVVEMRITDVGTGVKPDSVTVLLSSPEHGIYSGSNYRASQVSGTLRDGRWRTVVTFPEREVGGDWHLAVSATDRARPWRAVSNWEHWARTQWAKPYFTIDGLRHDALASGAGKFSIRGAGDSVPPTLESMSVDRPFVSSRQAEKVTMQLKAPDVGAGTSWVRVEFVSADGTATYPVHASRPDDTGTWQATVSFNKLPPGTYHGVIHVGDGRNTRVWTSSASYHEDDPAIIRSSAVPKVTVTLL